MYNEKEEIIAGTVGTVGTAAGIGVATAGASAATLTTGLASIGAIVGGGMATGIVMTAAAPVVVGAAAYGVAKGIKRIIRGY